MAKARWTTTDMPDQTGRVAIVTGANSGIGYETAKALAARGAEVVVAGRSAERGSTAVASLLREVPGASVRFGLLDLADQTSVRTFTQSFIDSAERLDLLINNAGVMNPPTRQETRDGFEMQMGTNHLGHFTLTLGLLPLLARTPDSRVVNVSSSAQNMGSIHVDDLQWAQRPYKGMQAYAASKIANMLFTLELQRRFEEAGLSTSTTAAHPGWTATNLQKTTRLFRMLNPIFAMQPWQGALPTLFAAVSDDAMPGGYFGPHGVANMRGYPVVNAPAKQSRDRDLAVRLWEESEDLVDFHWDEALTAARAGSA